jgi:tetratricopeptide (TPR) repeat protein
MHSKNETQLKKANTQLQRAKLLGRQGKHGDALLICEALIREFPNYVGALQTAAAIFVDQRNYPAALANLVRAEIADPDNFETLLILSDVYSGLGSPRKALRALNRAGQLNPLNASVQHKRGKMLVDLSDFGPAADAFQAAIKLESTDFASACSLAWCHVNMGKFSDAAALVETIARDHPSSIDLIEVMAQMPFGAMERATLSKALSSLQKLVSSSHGEPAHSVAFARAQILHKLALYDEAWEVFIRANAQVFATMADQYRSQLQFRRASLDELKKSKSRRAPRKAAGPTSLFIAGVSRSGKTVLENLLASSLGATRGHEILPHHDALICCLHRAGYPVLTTEISSLPESLYSLFGRLYLESLERRSGKSGLLTITHPGVIVDVDFINNLVPNSRFIFVKRNRTDLAFRIFASLYKDGHSYAYSLETISEYISWYEEMMEIAHEKTKPTSLVIHFEDIVSKPLKVVAEISELLGLRETAKAHFPEIGDDRGCSEPYLKHMQQKPHS